MSHLPRDICTCAVCASLGLCCAQAAEAVPRDRQPEPLAAHAVEARGYVPQGVVAGATLNPYSFVREPPPRPVDERFVFDLGP
jgi:hypothetical protein